MLSLDEIKLFLWFKDFTPSAVEPGRFRYGDEYDGEIVVRLRLREDNVV